MKKLNPWRMDIIDVTLGAMGLKGDKPAHEWDDTWLRFENPDGMWGDYVDLKGEQGDMGPQGKKGDKGDPGTPGSASVSGWSAYRNNDNGGLVIHSGEDPGWLSISGLEVTIDLSASALVQMSATGTQRTWGSGSSHVGYRFVIDGVGLGDATWGQTIQVNSESGSSWWSTWAFSDSIALSVGTHTIRVQAASRGASAHTAICGETNGTTPGYTGCNLNVIAFYQ
jgi:hypothetical protein